MAESKAVVLAALVANGAIAILKFVGFTLTGSAAMLSETYHSISDTGNQVFLLIGLRFGKREANQQHPFGTGKAQFFYSFLVAVLLFGIAGWESLKEGWHGITGEGAHLTLGTATIPVVDATVPAMWVNYAVLLAAVGFETWAWMKAWAGMKADMERHGWESFGEAFKKTANVTTLTALTEDSVALAGLVVALFGLVAYQLTGDPIYDSAAAFVIGLLLMGFALALAWENKRLLLGEALQPDEERALRETVAASEGVEEVVDLRSVYFGPETVVVTADVAFEDGMDTAEIDDRIREIETALREENDKVARVYVEPETDDGATASEHVGDRAGRNTGGGGQAESDDRAGGE